MATAAQRTSRQQLPRLGLSPEKGDEIVGAMFVAGMLLMLASLVTYHPLDPSILHHMPDDDAEVHNLIGPFGANLAAGLFALVGLTSFVFPALLATVAWRRFSRRAPEPIRGRVIGMLGVVVTLPAFLQLTMGNLSWRGDVMQGGGALGNLVAEALVARLNGIGTFVVLITLLFVAGSLAIRSTIWDGLMWSWRNVAGKMILSSAQRRKRQQDKSTRRRVLRAHLRRGGAGAVGAERGAKKTASSAVEEQRIDLPLRVIEKKGQGHFSVKRRTRTAGKGRGEVAKARAPLQADLGFKREEINQNELPPVNLLCTDLPEKRIDENELVRRGELIRSSSAEFGVEGSIDGISPGPVITVYEFQPAPGVKVSRIVGLQDDLALALRAESVRIDRIPGRSTLGIEVPNEHRSVIHLGQLIAGNDFKRSHSILTMALGVDIYGRPYYSDLANMPHLLVAGATGAGKSVGLLSMITSILYKATRDQVQFIFIDPKRIELGVFADIPHLKAEVVVEPRKAANALRWAVGEMERRYRLLAEVHVRSIDYYNRAIGNPKERQRLALGEGESEFDENDFKPLPYYVIIIDELADLMMVSSSEVEASIARLAQMARAVGIHLIVATQRPSVDVLTGTIKANFPCRLSFATATRHDSRTILDQVGSEKLLGRGDALFMAPGTSRVIRLHGAYVSEQETAGLIRWLKRRGRPNIDPEVVKSPENEKSGRQGSGGDGDDDLFDEAARLVVAEGHGSASFLQRRLRIGFSRAGRLIDMLAEDGILGPPQGSKPRELLVKRDYFDEIERQRIID